MTNSPSPNGSNGRDATGRFSKGNRGGPGNPYAKRAGELRAAIYEAVTEEDLRQVIQALLTQAKTGDIAAAKELLNRLLGKPEPIDLIARLETLEANVTEKPQ